MGSVATLPLLPNLGGSQKPPAIVPSAAGAAGTAGSVPITPSSTNIGVPTTGISAGLDTADKDFSLTGDFKESYGAAGKALAGVLGGLGSATDKAVGATNDSVLAAANRQAANIQATNAAHGISADSSASALGIGDFNAQVTQTLATTDSQMELQEENTLIDSLFKEGQAHGGDVSGWDRFMNVVKGVGSAVGDVAGAFIGDPTLGNQVTSIFGKGKTTPGIASVPGSEGGTLFDGGQANELDSLAGL